MGKKFEVRKAQRVGLDAADVEEGWCATLPILWCGLRFGPDFWIFVEAATESHENGKVRVTGFLPSVSMDVPCPGAYGESRCAVAEWTADCGVTGDGRWADVTGGGLPEETRRDERERDERQEMVEGDIHSIPFQPNPIQSDLVRSNSVQYNRTCSSLIYSLP